MSKRILVKIGSTIGTITSQRKRIFNKVSEGLNAIYDCMIDVAHLDDRIPNLRGYDMILFVFWDISNKHLIELKSIRSIGIPTLFFSDGLFNYHKKQGSPGIGLDYPLCIFSGGPQSAPFCNRHYTSDLPSDRLNLFGDEIELKDWNYHGKNVVLAYQGGVDYNLNSKNTFYKKCITKLKNSGYNVIFRLHPSYKKYKKSIIRKCKANRCDAVILPKRGEKSIDTNDIYCSISYGGKISSKYIIKGIPSFTIEDTISTPVCGKGLNIKDRVFNERSGWVNWLSYHHWTLNEFSSGDVLKFFLDNNYL